MRAPSSFLFTIITVCYGIFKKPHREIFILKSPKSRMDSSYYYSVRIAERPPTLTGGCGQDRRFDLRSMLLSEGGYRFARLNGR
jgi:hypothetical protein